MCPTWSCLWWEFRRFSWYKCSCMGCKWCWLLCIYNTITLGAALATNVFLVFIFIFIALQDLGSVSEILSSSSCFYQSNLVCQDGHTLSYQPRNEGMLFYHSIYSLECPSSLRMSLTMLAFQKALNTQAWDPESVKGSAFWLCWH